MRTAWYKTADCAKEMNLVVLLCSIQIRKIAYIFFKLCDKVEDQNELLEHFSASWTMRSHGSVGESTIALESPLSRCFIMINKTSSILAFKHTSHQLKCKQKRLAFLLSISRSLSPSLCLYRSLSLLSLSLAPITGNRIRSIYMLAAIQFLINLNHNKRRITV